MWATGSGPQRAKRLLFTGDLIDGRRRPPSGAWRSRRPPAAELDERFEELLQRIAQTPINQLVMMKLLVNQALDAQGLQATQAIGALFDGIARHTPEGYAFQQKAMSRGLAGGSGRARRPRSPEAAR